MTRSQCIATGAGSESLPDERGLGSDMAQRHAQDYGQALRALELFSVLPAQTSVTWRVRGT